ncbi:restriction endonuclease subunit S [Rahnella victoriana]|nr:restriction endonuclease subunit S [Rahnella victoriana]
MLNNTVNVRDGNTTPVAYKHTEIGIIPKDWNVVPLVNICKEIGDGIHATPIYSESGEYYFINGNNISNGNIFTDDNTKKVNESEFLKHQKKLTKKTILLSINGTIGNTALYKEEHLVLGKSAAYLTIKDNTSEEFIYYIIQTSQTKKQFDDGMTGSTIKNLGLATIRKTIVPVPTIEEQTAIASALSDTDALINALEQLITKKQAIKTTTMQQLLTGRTRLPKFTKNSNGNLKHYKHSDLGLIPEGWEISTLDKLGSFKNGVNKGAQDFGHGDPFVNLMDVFGKLSIDSPEHLGLIKSTDSDKKEYSLEKGDVLFIRSSVKPSGVGLTTLINNRLKNTVFSGFLIRFRSNEKICDKFKEYCFSERGFRERLIASSTVSANTNINQNSLKKMTILFPKELNEQIAIATILSDMDAELEALKQKLSKVRDIKQGMMQQLLTGRIRLPLGHRP